MLETERQPNQPESLYCMYGSGCSSGIMQCDYHGTGEAESKKVWKWMLLSFVILFVCVCLSNIFSHISQLVHSVTTPSTTFGPAAVRCQWYTMSSESCSEALKIIRMNVYQPFNTGSYSHPSTGLTAWKSQRIYRYMRVVSCSHWRAAPLPLFSFLSSFMSNLKGETRLIWERHRLAAELRTSDERGSSGTAVMLCRLMSAALILEIFLL